MAPSVLLPPAFSLIATAHAREVRVEKADVDKGQEHGPFHSVPETLLSSTDSYQRLFLLTTLSTTPTRACLPLERDWSRDPLTAKRCQYQAKPVLSFLPRLYGNYRNTSPKKATVQSF